MARYILILSILFISLIRYNKNITKGVNPHYLLLSTLIQFIPLSGILYKLGSINVPFGIRSGATDLFFAIDALWIIYIIIIIFKPHIVPFPLRVKIKSNNKTFIAFSILEIISLFNPINNLHYTGLPTYFRIVQIFLFLKIISQYISCTDILKGFFDGFKWAVGLQFIITTLFPVLHITLVSDLFRAEGADWAFRRDVASAIGTFIHPGSLALFCCMSIIFFFSCYLNRYNIKESKKYILMCIYIIFFTYSRTSYLTVIGGLLFVYIVFSNRKKIQIKTLILFITGLLFIITIFLFTPLSDMFFKSDIDTQIENRELHFLLALGCFHESPILGVGLNNHVNYLYHQFNTNLVGHVEDFFVTNPVHNSHLIILAETGIIGFSLWCYYLISRIYRGFKYSIDMGLSINIINLSFAGMLIMYMTYGMTGWSCFHREIYPILIIMGFFTQFKSTQKKHKNCI